MGSHNVTCHPTQVNAPRQTPAMQAGTRLTYPQRDGRLSWLIVDLMAPRPGVRHPTTTAPPRKLWCKYDLSKKDTIPLMTPVNYSLESITADGMRALVRGICRQLLAAVRAERRKYASARYEAWIPVLLRGKFIYRFFFLLYHRYYNVFDRCVLLSVPLCPFLLFFVWIALTELNYLMLIFDLLAIHRRTF